MKKWHSIAKKWRRGNTAKECRDTFQCLQDLSSFLMNLEKDLGEVVGKIFFLLLKKKEIHSSSVLRKLIWNGGGATSPGGTYWTSRE